MRSVCEYCRREFVCEPHRRATQRFCSIRCALYHRHAGLGHRPHDTLSRAAACRLCGRAARRVAPGEVCHRCQAAYGTLVADLAERTAPAEPERRAIACRYEAVWDAKTRRRGRALTEAELDAAVPPERGRDRP